MQTYFWREGRAVSYEELREILKQIINRKVIDENIKKSVTHDHLYHTVLGMLRVQSKTYDPKWDLSKKAKGD